MITVISGLIVVLINTLRSDMKDIRSDMRDIRSDMKQLAAQRESDMKQLAAQRESDMTEIRSEMKQLAAQRESDMTEIRSEMKQLAAQRESDMTEIRSEIKNMGGQIGDLTIAMASTAANGSPETISQANSPPQLGQLGRLISATASAGEWARDNVSQLLGETAGKEDYEIDDLCAEYVEKCYAEEKEFHKTVRSAAFRHSRKPDEVLEVFRIELRNQMFAANRIDF